MDTMHRSLEALNQRDLEDEDGVSAVCMEQTMKIYKDLIGEAPRQDFDGPPLDDLPPPLPFLSIVESMPDEEFCKTPFPSVICNLKKVLFDISHQCLHVGGMPVPLNIKIKCDGIEGPDIKVKNIPFCAGRSCDENLVHLMNNMISDAGLFGDAPCSGGLTVAHDTMRCLEVSEKRFTIESNGKKRKCKWLQRKPLETRMRLCGGSQDIRDACGQTCCQCSNENERKLDFIRSVPDGVAVHVVTKNCAWLARQSDKVKRRRCSTKKARFPSDGIGGYEPAWKQCPSTCGRCPALD